MLRTGQVAQVLVVYVRVSSSVKWFRVITTARCKRKLPIWKIVVLEESKKPEKELISYANETLLLIIQEIRRFERAYISCSFDNVITSVCIVFFLC